MGQTSAQGEAYWRVHVEAWRASGQSRADYCTAHGLSRKTFGWWAWRLDRQAPAAPGAHFLPVEVTGVGGPDEVTVTPPTDGTRIEIALPDGVTVRVGRGVDNTRIEIALPDGVTVRVGRGVDGEALRRVLTALGR